MDRITERAVRYYCDRNTEARVPPPSRDTQFWARHEKKDVFSDPRRIKRMDFVTLRASWAPD